MPASGFAAGAPKGKPALGNAEPPDQIQSQVRQRFLQEGNAVKILPSWIMPGPDKCGITDVFKSIVIGHPQVSDQVHCKEHHFWDNDVYFGGCNKKNARVSFAVEQYRKNFPLPCQVLPPIPNTPTAFQVAGEATPDYFFLKQVPYRLSMFMPASLKLIFAFRDPTKRFISRLVGNIEHPRGFTKHGITEPTCTEILSDYAFRTKECASS